MYIFKDKTTTVTEKVIDSIICNDCRKKISMDKSEDIIERQELVSIRFTGGYGSIFGIAYGGGRFVAVGNRKAWWSPDGSAGSWIESNPGGTHSYNGIAYGGGRFVVVGSVGQAWWSPDGSAGSWMVLSQMVLSQLYVGFKNPTAVNIY